MKVYTNATAKDLRIHARQLLEAVERGEDVVISHRGKPIARMVPVSKRKMIRRAHKAVFGIWSDHREMSDVVAYVDCLRQGRT